MPNEQTSRKRRPGLLLLVVPTSRARRIRSIQTALRCYFCGFSRALYTKSSPVIAQGRPSVIFEVVNAPQIDERPSDDHGIYRWRRAERSVRTRLGNQTRKQLLRSIRIARKYRCNGQTIGGSRLIGIFREYFLKGRFCCGGILCRYITVTFGKPDVEFRCALRGWRAGQFRHGNRSSSRKRNILRALLFGLNINALDQVGEIISDRRARGFELL